MKFYTGKSSTWQKQPQLIGFNLKIYNRFLEKKRKLHY